MSHLTPRRAHTALGNYFRPSGLLTTMIWIFALGAVSCKKHIPESLLCTCDVSGQGEEKSSKGEETFKGLAICGVFNFPIPKNTDRSADIQASLGGTPYGTYAFAELLANPSQNFFSVPDLEAHTANFEYFISASVKDLKGNPLVEIKDNKWFVYTGNVGKYNYDSAGFEVYDKAGHISLSFNYIQEGTFFNLAVQGVIPDSDSTLEYYANGVYQYIDFQYGTPALNEAFQVIEDGLPIQPIFRYTGVGWQHARLPN
jgi:hypothetical protein